MIMQFSYIVCEKLVFFLPKGSIKIGKESIIDIVPFPDREYLQLDGALASEISLTQCVQCWSGLLALASFLPPASEWVRKCDVSVMYRPHCKASTP